MKLLLFALTLFGLHGVRAADGFHATACEGTYPRHLQGICTDGKSGIFWCWTDALVKTDLDGRLLKQVPVRFLRLSDDIVLWSAPMELFCEISNTIRDRSPFTPSAAEHLSDAVNRHLREIR